MKRSKRSGFTLIELLVVIAIIAILAAILFPVFAQAREKARAITCLSNTKQLALAVMNYVDSSNVYPPQGLPTHGHAERLGLGIDDFPFHRTASALSIAAGELRNAGGSEPRHNALATNRVQRRKVIAATRRCVVGSNPWSSI